MGKWLIPGGVVACVGQATYHRAESTDLLLADFIEPYQWKCFSCGQHAHRVTLAVIGVAMLVTALALRIVGRQILRIFSNITAEGSLMGIYICLADGS